MINLEFYREKINEFLDNNLSFRNELSNTFGYEVNWGENFVSKFIDWMLEEHIGKIYKDDFFEKFPYATAGDKGYPKIDWCELYNDGECPNWHCQTSEDCLKCWDKEMEEE